MDITLKSPLVNNLAVKPTEPGLLGILLTPVIIRPDAASLITGRVNMIYCLEVQRLYATICTPEYRSIRLGKCSYAYRL